MRRAERPGLERYVGSHATPSRPLCAARAGNPIRLLGPRESRSAVRSVTITPARILVANAGTHPEPSHLAAGLLRAGASVTYATSASWPSDGIAVNFAGTPLGRRIPFLRELRRRRLPTALDRRVVVRVAGWAEAVFQLVRIAAPSQYRRALTWRTRAFSRRLARRIDRRQEFDVVVAQQTCALEAFEAAASSSKRILSYPIAHHRWMMRELSNEAARNPSWRGSLQGIDRDPQELERLDREIRMADLVFVPSMFVHRTFVEFGVPEQKLRIVPLGADVSELRLEGTDPTPSAPPRSGFRVLFAGQLTQRKGLSYTIEGFTSAGLDDATLQLVGAPVGDALDHIPKRPDITISPSVARKELGREYDRADVLVLASLAEGFPLVAIEAMSCGTPCVLSTSTFAEDVVTDGVDGLIVPPADSESIATALRTLAGDRELLTRMSSAARSRAGEFTWDAYAARSSALVLDLVAGGTGTVDRQIRGPI